MQLSWMRTGLALAAVTTGLLLMSTIGARATEQIRGAPADWPTEVPIYPGTKVVECHEANPSKCLPNPMASTRGGSAVTTILAIIDGVFSVQDVRQWYKSELLTDHWVFVQDTPNSTSFVYKKCSGKNESLKVSIWPHLTGPWAGAPVELFIQFERAVGDLNCKERIGDNFPGNSAGSAVDSPAGMTELCALNGEPAKEASGLKSEIQTGFGVNICESDLCGTGLKAPPGFSVTPWSPDGLQVVESTLNLLNKSCFLKNAGLESVCKSGSQEKEMCSGSSSAYASPTDHKVVLCYDRWGIKDQKKIANEFYGEGTELLQQLLVHEIGHVYWRKSDGSLDFDKVSSFLMEAGYLDCTTMLGCLGVAGGGFATPPAGAPSEYAATGPAEDFAESVRFYVTQPDKLRERSPLRYRYLKNSAFCGYEYGTN